MVVLLLLIFCAVLVCVGFASATVSIHLTSSNFSTVTSAPFVAVLFYAPWCEFCKQARPRFERAAGALVSSSAAVTCASFEATIAEHEDISARHLVERGVKLGVPTIKLFRAGVDVGPVPAAVTLGDWQGIVHFLQRHALTRPLIVNEPTALDAMQKQSSVVLLGLFGAEQSQSSAFNFVARTYLGDTVDFAVSTNAMLWRRFHAPALVLLRRFDEPVVWLNPPWTTARINSFLAVHSEPLLGELCDTAPCSHTAMTYTAKFAHRKDNRPTAVLFVEHASHIEVCRNALRAAALRLRGQVVFAVVVRARFEQLLSMFHVRAMTLPVMVVHDQRDSVQNVLHSSADHGLQSGLSDFQNANRITTFVQAVLQLRGGGGDGDSDSHESKHTKRQLELDHRGGVMQS